MDSNDNVIFLGGPYSSKYTNYALEDCLNEGLYKFQIFDSYGDGINGDSGYTISIDNEIIKEGGGSSGFGSSEECNFAITLPSNTPSNSVYPSSVPSKSLQPTFSTQPSLGPSKSIEPSSTTILSLTPSFHDIILIRSNLIDTIINPPSEFILSFDLQPT